MRLQQGGDMNAWRNLTIVLVLAVGACSTTPQTTLVTGSLSYRERIALPPGAKAEIAVVPAGPANAAPILRRDVPIQGQAPLPFQLELQSDALDPGQHYTLRGSITGGDGAPLWRGDSTTPINPGPGKQDVGTIVLAHVTPPLPKPSLPAAGTRPQLQGYVARGNEPGWMLQILATKLTFEESDGATKLQATVPPRQKIAGGYRYLAHAGKQTLRIDVLNKVCRDDSGAAFPDNVTVLVGGKTLRGCGGDPAFALQHARWMVRSIDGKDVEARSRPTLVFESTGRVAGHASCNSYSGPYQVGGADGMRFGDLISTKRACAPTLMQQETAMLAVLNNAIRYTLGDDGTLTIETNDGHRLVARKG
jgi:heat shock protein HslJ/uncharacterized lipoprotein YbaY/uncharacterized membrane protein